MKNGLTLTIIFEAESANYGEGIGNIAILKKMRRGDGKRHFRPVFLM
jgi:CRISPR-associated protein Cst2